MPNNETIDAKREIQNTLFHDLFSRPPYTRQMYTELHPEAKNIKEEDLKIVTLQDILVNRMHNDLGFIVNDNLIVLMEAQSTWALNILVRLFMYLGQTYHDLIIETEQDVYSTKKITIPKPEFYVVYTGEERIVDDVISLNKEFFAGECWAMDLKAKVIYNSDGRTLLNQYIFFCRTWREQRKLHKDRQVAIEETLRICREQKILVDYLAEREKEVISMMKLLFDEDFIQEMHDKAIAKDAKIEGLAEGDILRAQKTALNMHKKGQSDSYIAEILEVSLDTVSQWLKDKAI